MRARMLGSRAFARVTLAVLAAGVCVLAGLAFWATAITVQATERVAESHQISDGWAQLFDHINLEQDMMRSFVATGDEDQRQAFAQTIGGGEPTIAALSRLGDGEHRIETTRVLDAYHRYTAVLHEILAAGTDRAQLQMRGESAAATVRAQVLASMANDNTRARGYLRDANRRSTTLRVAVGGSLAVCLGLLAVCTLMLYGYQRRAERQAEASRYEALHDDLTGLANRVLLRDRAEVALRTAGRHAEKVGLLIIDLDRFKEVNDTLGHHNGDSLLRQVAEHLREAVRECDTVARLGGDEFAVLLPRIPSIDVAVEAAHRLLTTLHSPIYLNNFAMEVSGSIGVAIYPDHSATTEQLLQHADIAMYAAKRNHSGVARYEGSQNPYHPEHLMRLGELRRAIERRELVLYYQPKADARDGRVCGVEALVRWLHPELGLLGPAQFVQLAEHGGLIDQMTDYVLAEALEQCARWRRRGVELPVSVNVSALCLGRPDLPERAAARLAANQLPASMLTLEITESALIADPPGALRQLAKIRDLGIQVSIDDFGTGYSSMAYLQEMPLNEIKIDRRFITRLTRESSNSAIVGAVLDLARNLDLQVVAEGVEDEETWSALAGRGCQTIQGFYLSKPLPASELDAWLTGQEIAVPSYAG